MFSSSFLIFLLRLESVIQHIGFVWKCLCSLVCCFWSHFYMTKFLILLNNAYGERQCYVVSWKKLGGGELTNLFHQVGNGRYQKTSQLLLTHRQLSGQTFTFCPQRSCIRKINSLDATSLLGFKGIAWDNHSQRLVSFPLALHCPGVLSCPDFIAESTRTVPPSCRYTDSTVCSRDEQPEKQNNTFHISFTLSQTNQTAYSLFQTRALHRSVEVNPPPLVHSSGDPASSLKFFWD